MNAIHYNIIIANEINSNMSIGHNIPVYYIVYNIGRYNSSKEWAVCMCTVRICPRGHQCINRLQDEIHVY